jgi:phospholipid transport system substrate-binding protein
MHITGTTRAFVTATLAGALVVACTATARAGVPTDQLRAHVDRVLQILQDPELKKESKAAERRAAIRKVANETFDFEETAKRSLGRHWQARTPEERRQFVPLFTDLLESAYISRLEQYQGEKVQYVGETVEGDLAVVRTKILTPKGSEIPVDYRLERRDGQWKVYDVVIEGVSLVANYRTQFNKIIETSSYQALVDRMKAKAFTAPGTERRAER